MFHPTPSSDPQLNVIQLSIILTCALKFIYFDKLLIINQVVVFVRWQIFLSSFILFLSVIGRQRRSGKNSYFFVSVLSLD